MDTTDKAFAEWCLKIDKQITEIASKKPSIDSSRQLLKLVERRSKLHGLDDCENPPPKPAPKPEDEPK